MDKMMVAPPGGIIRQVRVSYQNGAESFLRVFDMSWPLTLAIDTRYGILYAAIGMAPNPAHMPLFLLDFDTRAPSDTLRDQAVKDFGTSFKAPAKDVAWTARAGVDYRIHNSDKGLTIKSQLHAIDYCGGTFGTSETDERERSTTKFFLETVIPEVTRELGDMKILQQGAVMALLKFKALVPTRPYSKAELNVMMPRVEKVLRSLIRDDDRAAILMHADRDIRLAGLAALAQDNKPEKTPKR